MSARSERIARLEAAIGPCSRYEDRDEQLKAVLRMLNDGPSISLVLLKRLKEKIA